MQAARRRARELTLEYEHALAPTGLTGGQFSTLVAVGAGDGAAMKELAHVLGLDATTLSRGLRPLERRKLVNAVVDPADARGRRIRLTAEGKALLDRAIPLWETVQSRLQE